MLLWLIVITFLPGALRLLICSHRFIVGSLPHLRQGLTLTEGDAELGCSHLCPSVLVSGRPCGCLGVAALSGERAEATFSLSDDSHGPSPRNLQTQH